MTTDSYMEDVKRRVRHAAALQEELNAAGAGDQRDAESERLRIDNANLWSVVRANGDLRMQNETLEAEIKRLREARDSLAANNVALVRQLHAMELRAAEYLVELNNLRALHKAHNSNAS